MSVRDDIPACVADQAALDDPRFDDAGRVHDWRNHVGDRVRALWSAIPPELRLAIAADADDRASREDWD